jgi:hypothetical protein
MLNALSVLMGTIGMSFYSLQNMQWPPAVSWIFFKSTLPAIFILWTKLPLSWLILKKIRPHAIYKRERGCVE